MIARLVLFVAVAGTVTSNQGTAGTADWRVSPLDSLDLSRELLKHRVPHRLVMFEGGDHFLSEFSDEKNQLTRAWLDRFVLNGNPLPNIRPHGD